MVNILCARLKKFKPIQQCTLPGKHPQLKVADSVGNLTPKKRWTASIKP